MPDDKTRSVMETIASYGKGLMRFIRSRVKSEADAEDVLQEVWYQLSAVVNGAPVEQTGAWLYRVARNKITDRSRKKKEEYLDNYYTAGEGFDFKALLLADAATPETEFIHKLFWEELFAALNELPAAQRDIFVKHEIEGIPFAELAAQYNENVQTLVTRKRYAVLHLRRRLRQLYADIVND